MVSRRLGRPGRFALRFVLWALPVVLAGQLLLWTNGAEVEATLAGVEESLLRGEAHEAFRLLEQIEHQNPGDPAIPLARRLAAAFLGEDDSAMPARVGAEVDRFPIPLIIRNAFERGDFDAALRLTALAQGLGRSTVPAVTSAALIENGGLPGGLAQILPIADTVQPSRSTVPGSRLLARLDDHRHGMTTTTGLLLRDRDGVAIGVLDAEGGLELAPRVESGLVPETIRSLGARIPAAGSLRLSLDLELAEAALAAFGRWYRGTIVLVDPASGEILAAVSDRRTQRQGGTPAFEEYREPASISKLITTTAALRSGLSPDEEIGRMRCRGHERYAGELLYCPHIAGPLRGLDRALGISCNVAFASLGVEVGRRGLLDELERFGFGHPLGSFTGGRILQARGNDRQLADLAIGLDDTELTPLHGALIAAVMANDGVMPEPTLVRAEDGRLGLHPRPLPRGEGRQVVDPAWIPEIVRAMEVVAERGTGRGMAPRNFPVAMKTGTASHPRYGFHVNYIGFGPNPHARVAFCVRVTHQPTSKKVRTAAREVTRRLLRSLGRIAETRGWHDGPRTDDDSLWDSPQLAHHRPHPETPVVVPSVAR